MFYEGTFADPRPIYGAVRKYNALTLAFLRSLQASMYFTGGQSPRGDGDLWEIRFKNILDRQRNLVYFDESLVYVSGANKTLWKNGRERAIPHVYPKVTPSTQVIRYLAYFRPLEIALVKLDPSSWKGDSLYEMEHKLFSCLGTNLHTTDFSSYMRAITTKMLKLPHHGMGIASLRQVSAFIGIRYMHAKVRQDKQDELQAAIEAQSGHSSDMARRFYGLELEHLPANIAKDVFIRFKTVSFLHHHFYSLQDNSRCELPILSIYTSSNALDSFALGRYPSSAIF